MGMTPTLTALALQAFHFSHSPPQKSNPHPIPRWTWCCCAPQHQFGPWRSKEGGRRELRASWWCSGGAWRFDVAVRFLFTARRFLFTARRFLFTARRFLFTARRFEFVLAVTCTNSSPSFTPRCLAIYSSSVSLAICSSPMPLGACWCHWSSFHVRSTCS
ncbi:hypothetical protein BCR34DRAFT_326230 [Clohesyomyces aquaticus]|uniref:Uncharacterized protein n=1 Tax=Clohesyomyces aquaticus TaxID=1231657 RepID=A0A1Y1ZNL8_9PLEO|nr:hypothetical protein BCR34DRAFT_326230 [Clohesyomyces aquaticus]